MSVSKEAEKLEAFKAAYPGDHEVLRPNSGIADCGFRLVTFDPETKYAQFKNRGTGLWHARYVEFVLSPTGSITRNRLYLSLDARHPLKTLSLNSVKVEYPLRNNVVSWSAHFEETTPSYVAIGEVVFPNSGSNILLAKFWYPSCEPLPDVIDIAVGTLTKALDERWAVPPHFTIRCSEGVSKFAIFGVEATLKPNFRLGYAEAGEPFTHPDFPGVLTIMPLENGSLRIVREAKTRTVLEVPKLDFVDLNTRLRGNWSGYASLPQSYPVDFQSC